MRQRGGENDLKKNKWLQIKEKIAHKELNSYNTRKTVQLKKQEHFPTE
jgi:cephalosporin-C deacetylase-like acetyl esterase